MGRVFVGLGLGAIVGYFLGAFLGCGLLIPESNLCGLGGALIGVPVGGVAGALIARPRREGRPGEPEGQGGSPGG